MEVLHIKNTNTMRNENFCGPSHIEIDKSQNKMGLKKKNFSTFPEK